MSLKDYMKAQSDQAVLTEKERLERLTDVLNYQQNIIESIDVNSQKISEFEKVQKLSMLNVNDKITSYAMLIMSIQVITSIIVIIALYLLK